jgi:hypothetical protein
MFHRDLDWQEHRLSKRLYHLQLASSCPVIKNILDQLLGHLAQNLRTIEDAMANLRGKSCQVLSAIVRVLVRQGILFESPNDADLDPDLSDELIPLR